jgi:hypothetical protein
MASSSGTPPGWRSGGRRSEAWDGLEAVQAQHLPARAEDGPTKACPYCAETIKQAARVCRFCNRELL